MCSRKKLVTFLSMVSFAVIAILLTNQISADELTSENAWQALPGYEYGQDMAVLLTMDRVVIEAMATPESQAACAARLAKLLTAEGTTPAAQQYICLQLRQVGTSAEVPTLAKLLDQPEAAEMARHALQAIPGEASAAVLREALTKAQGTSLIGIIHSVGARKDGAAVGRLQDLAAGDDRQAAVAAIHALGTIADEPSIAFLVQLAGRATAAAPQGLGVALLRCGLAMERNGQSDSARAVFDPLSQPGQPAGVRRAALEGILRLQADAGTETILSWFADRSDADRRQIAAGHLQSLPDGELDRLLENLADLPDAGKLAVIELATTRRGKDMLPMVLSLAKSENPELRLAGVRCLGMVGDASTIGLLVDLLATDDDSATLAQNALAQLPRKEVTAALLAALKDRPEIRTPVIAILIELKCYDAIDPLIEIASDPDPTVYDPALIGLRGIADPDKTDMPRLVKLLLRAEPGRHQDEVEKTILIVAEKLPAGADRAELVLAALANVPAAEAPKYLPVLGRLGGSAALGKIRTALNSPDADIQSAAVRALCNWPNADVADDLLKLAADSKDKTFRHWALRAYIRVITLESDRPESETLTMLQQAMKLAESKDDKQLAVQRASTVRTMEAVNWIAQFLDDADLAQDACLSIVELAHHRFLRHPNMDRFGPLLDKVAQLSRDAEVVERAKRYRLGL